VGVLLDMLRQTETHLLQRHYDGFLRKGKIKGRYDRGAPGGAKTASSTVLVYLWTFAAVLILVGVVAWLNKG
jgi:preprotein translocase subunit SecY